MSARKKVNQSRPRPLPDAAVPDAAGSACLDAGDGAPAPRWPSGPPSSSSAIVDSSLSPAPQGSYGVGFRPNAPCIGLPSLFVPRAQPGRMRIEDERVCSRELNMRKGGEFKKAP
jgi:hypothetical protein